MNNSSVTLENFEQQISPTIVNRGFNYFRGGNVQHLASADNKKWVAQVIGTTRYSVEISLSGKQVVSWYCDCPYDYGPVCKHTVAVLYAIRERSENGNNSTRVTPRKSTDQRFHDLVEKSNVDILRQFLHEYGNFHPEMMQEFLANYAAVSDQNSWQDYVAIIRDSVRHGSDRHGFVDYSHSFEVMKPVDKLITHARRMMESGDYQGAWQISRAVITEIPKLIQCMDDSSGGGGFATDKALEFLAEIGQESDDDKLIDEIYDFIMKELPKQKYSDFGFDDTLITIARSLTRTPKQIRKLEKAHNTRLENAQKQGEDFGYEFTLQRAVEQKITFLQEFGRTKEAEQLIDDHLEIVAFRDQRIREAIERKNYNHAKSLVRSGAELSKNLHQPWYQEKHWDDWFLKIAEAEQDTKAIREYARKLFLMQGHNFDYYKKLKATYTREQWEKEVPRIIANLKRSGGRLYSVSPTGTLAEIYRIEGQQQALLDLLRTNPQIQFVKNYGKLLSDQYPKEILSIYKEILRKHAKFTGREKYQELVRILNSIQDIEGGLELVRQLVDEFRKTYKRRPAMMEELNRVNLR